MHVTLNRLKIKYIFIILMTFNLITICSLTRSHAWMFWGGEERLTDDEILNIEINHRINWSRDRITVDIYNGNKNVIKEITFAVKVTKREIVERRRIEFQGHYFGTRNIYGKQQDVDKKKYNVSVEIPPRSKTTINFDVMRIPSFSDGYKFDYDLLILKGKKKD